VLTDVVPSKTLIATSDVVTETAESEELGVTTGDGGVGVDLRRVNERVRKLARAQSADTTAAVASAGVQIVTGTGRLLPGDRVVVDLPGGGSEEFHADVTLVATGARPRILPDAMPDGER